MGGNSLRPNVLSLYRQILRMGKTWEAISGNSFDTKLERDYIMNEARHLFRKNRYLQDETEIQLRLREAESRLALALHYKTPYPRPVNVPPMTYAKAEGGKRGTAQERQIKQATPVYIKSLQETQ